MQIYLSGSGELPEENSISRENWYILEQEKGRLIMMTYSQLKKWCIDSAEKCKAPRLRYFIEDFADYIRDEFEGGGTAMEREMVIRQLTKKENISAAFEIGSLWPDTTKILITKLAELVKQRLEAMSGPWEIEVDFSYYSADSGFYFFH